MTGQTYEVQVEPDRRVAIGFALGQAQPGDLVLIAGKGHETVQVIGDRELPFDDRQVALEELGAIDMIRILVAAGSPSRLSALLTRVLIDVLTRSQIGQPIREDGPQGHMVKAGTPTMGGLAIVAGALGGYGLSDLISEVSPAYRVHDHSDRPARYGCDRVGWDGRLPRRLDQGQPGTKSRSEREAQDRRALDDRRRLRLLAVNLTSVHTDAVVCAYSAPGIDLGTVGWIIWAVVLIYAHVELGQPHRRSRRLGCRIGHLLLRRLHPDRLLDLSGNRREPIDIYEVPHALDIAVVAVAMLAACAGFLWFNAAPAEIFMGDTGSLAIGTGLAALALVTNTHLLLAIIGGVYVIETLSVMLQVGFFKATGASDSSGWLPSTTISSSPAGRRPRSSSGSGSSVAV